MGFGECFFWGFLRAGCWGFFWEGLVVWVLGGFFFDIQMNPSMWSMLTLPVPWCVKVRGAFLTILLVLDGRKPYFYIVSSLSLQVKH